MKKRIMYCCIFCTLLGAFVGATIGALSQDTNASMLLGTGIGSVCGLALGAVAGLLSPDQWEGIGKALEALAILGEFLECCALASVLFFSLTAAITTFLFGHQLWLAVLVGCGTGVSLICLLFIAVLVERKTRSFRFTMTNV